MHLKLNAPNLDILSLNPSGERRSGDLKAAQSGSNEAKMSIRVTSLSLLSAVFVAGLAFAGPALAEEDCNWYGVKSAQQQQENIEKACNLTGDIWNADVKVHVDFCQTVSPDEWRKIVADRQALLDKCGG